MGCWYSDRSGGGIPRPPASRSHNNTALALYHPHHYHYHHHHYHPHLVNVFIIGVLSSSSSSSLVRPMLALFLSLGITKMMMKWVANRIIDNHDDHHDVYSWLSPLWRSRGRKLWGTVRLSSSGRFLEKSFSSHIRIFHDQVEYHIRYSNIPWPIWTFHRITTTTTTKSKI